MLTQETITIIKKTLPVLANAGTELTDYFYQRLFKHNPELKHIFNLSNQRSGKQQVALFSAIAAYAHHIENLEQLSQAVERIAHKHTSFNIQADHYQIVGHHLLATLEELAPEVFDKDTLFAWQQAYEFLATLFINREAALYLNSESTQGGWSGFRTFEIIKKEKESELVTSFVFKPKDGGIVRDFLAGQYLGIKIISNELEFEEIRQYSLSDRSHGQHYRISVKRESMIDDKSKLQKGLVSNYLHDQMNVGDCVELSAPAGDFYLNSNNTNPNVLISAGVGITPMQCMLETLINNKNTNDLYFLHACENALQHSFSTRLSQLKQAHTHIKPYIWYQQAHNQTILGEDYDFDGLMDLSNIETSLPLSKGEFYLCGPVGFMKAIKAQLLSLNVNESRIHYEVFGPHDHF